jgi:hypothetical protein
LGALNKRVAKDLSHLNHVVPQDGTYMRNLSLLVGFAMVITAALAGAASLDVAGTSNTTWRDGAVQNALTALAALGVVALFVERTLEVFMNVWRTPKRAMIEKVVAEASDAVRAIDTTQTASPAGTEARANLYKVQSLQSSFSARTRSIALVWGLMVGVLVSLVTPGILDSVMTVTASPGWQWSESLFHAIDIIITGALIGGGSVGLHQMTSTIGEFFAQTRAGLKPPG